MSSMEGRTVFSRIPYLLDNYEPRKSISMEGKSINSDRVTPDSSHGPWFPIPQMQYNQQEIEEFKKLEKGDTTPPNFISFMYEYNRAYPDNYCDNAIMVNLQTKKHSPMDIETLHTFGTKLNFKTRSYTYRNSVPDLHKFLFHILLRILFKILKKNKKKHEKRRSTNSQVIFYLFSKNFFQQITKI